MARPGTHLKSFVALALIISAQISWAISKEMQDLVTLETNANAAATRSNQMVQMEHYEIPLALLEADVALRANPEFMNALVFEKDGKKYVRWIINPEDTKWHKEVEKFLEKNNIKPVKKKYFEGYMTASRSYIVVDPKSGAEFSFKGSTDKTGGAWKDKQQTWDDGQQIRLMTDFVNQQLKNQPKLENSILLDEAIAIGIKELDQAMIIRSYEGLTKSGKRYVPGFSIMHDKVGKALAAANGSNDPAAFWNEHYNKPLARALAEFMALTGMTYDSPHSQNFLVELDAKNRPTGKIVLRDYGDTYLSTEFFTAAKRTDILKKWEQDNIKVGEMKVAVGILHGNKAPTWMEMQKDTTKNSSYDQWGRDFFAEFEKEFARQTGVNLGALQDKPERAGNYIRQYYSTTDAAGKQWTNLTKKGAQRNHLLIMSCERVLLAM
ncbi:hypothetical protein [Bdellovibrio sp. HCB337]|uniref:hypothetical protein n=1 Tax=Bdellovibrio sp. HCB337 TaxID=3394358 RepID=UPI0039A77574